MVDNDKTKTNMTLLKNKTKRKSKGKGFCLTDFFSKLKKAFKKII